MSSVPIELDAWWDDLFHGAALAAFCHQAVTEHRFPPDVEATRQRAYRYYEEELAKWNIEKSRQHHPSD